MKRWMGFLLGLALVAFVGGAALLGCLPDSSAAGVPPVSPTSEPSSVPGGSAAASEASLVWERRSAAGCSGLRIDDLSHLYLVPCGEAGASAQFTEEELVMYLGYVARYAPFSWSQEAAAENGMIAVRLEFLGRGTREAAEADRAALAAWAGEVHARLVGDAEQGALVETARTMLAARLGIAPEVIVTASVEPVTWPDSCLGISETGRACAEVETPGYRIVLRVGTDTYTYHTDRKGSVRLGVSQRTPTPPATTAAPTAPPTATVTPQATATAAATQRPTQTPLPTHTPVPSATFTPTPVPTWTPAPAPTDHWRAEYYTNERLLGVPAVVAREDSPNHAWGYGGPSGVPADYFSARWRRRVYFEEGQYDFRLEADDGVRLWVGGTLIIDRWSGGLQVNTVNQKGLPAGELEVVLEYFELEGYAKVDLSWSKVYIPPTPAPEPVITDWRGEYYNNTGLQGLPSLITNEPTIQFDWGEGSPHAVIGRDRFSARYTRRLVFSPANYRLTVTVDDGVRVWVDNRPVIDAWQTGIRRTYIADLHLDGAHDLRIEYLEEGGAATLDFGWQALGALPPATPRPTPVNTMTPTAAPPTPSPTATLVPTSVWLGEYFANAELQGAPVVARNEPTLSFEWGEASPASGVPADRFSARYTRRVTLAPGNYRIGLVADDGGRVYVDGRLVIDEWRSGPRRHTTTDLALGGEHVMRVEYFEQAGGAALYFGLEALPGPTPIGGTAPVLPTPTPAALWKGEYYDNPDLLGNPKFERNEVDLAFDWREGSPDPRIHGDTFSARYTRSVSLPSGTYSLHVVVDDGARVYVDGQLVIDEWDSGIRRHVIHEMALGGVHTFGVEYWENKGGAALFFAWEGLTGAAETLGADSGSLAATIQAARGADSIYEHNRRGR